MATIKDAKKALLTYFRKQVKDNAIKGDVYNVDIDIKKVQKLIDNGADVLAVDKDGHTSLYYALYTKENNRLELVKLLHDNYPPNLNASFGLSAILEIACTEDIVDVVDYLIKHNVSHNKEKLLLLVSSLNCPNIVKYLIDRNTNINIQGDFKNTPLTNACYHGNPDIVEMLLDVGANINSADYLNKTALQIAMSEKSTAERSSIDMSWKIQNYEKIISLIKGHQVTKNISLIDSESYSI